MPLTKLEELSEQERRRALRYGLTRSGLSSAEQAMSFDTIEGQRAMSDALAAEQERRRVAAGTGLPGSGLATGRAMLPGDMRYTWGERQLQPMRDAMAAVKPLGRRTAVGYTTGGTADEAGPGQVMDFEGLRAEQAAAREAARQADVAEQRRHRGGFPSLARRARVAGGYPAPYGNPYAVMMPRVTTRNFEPPAVALE